MAENDIIVAKEGASGGLTEIALTPSDIGAAPATGILPSAISGVAVVASDPRLSDSRTPTAHAASHAAAGGDPLAPSDIGAQYAFVTSSANLTADTTLSSGRTRKIFLNNYSSPAATITVTLPTTGNENGDILVLEGSTVVDDIDIKNSPTGSVIATISASGQTFRFIYVGSWEIDRVYNHASQHASGGIDELALAASQITSGTLTHERGGLEANVSSYNGLLKIASGSTSAVTVTSAGEALLDDADASAQRTTLGLGNSATLDTGTTAGTVAEGDHTHADLHTRSHAITSTSDHTAGNHKVFYSNGSGEIQELALGNSGEVLTSNGATSAPSFAAASGGVTGAAASASDVLGVSGSDITGVDATADRIVFWDDSESKLAYGTPSDVGAAASTLIGSPIEYVVACSDETSDLTTGTAKVTFRAPVAFLLTGVAASVNTAPTGSTLIVDINNGANSALSTKLSIDASEKTSATAATAAVIDTTYDDFAADAEITIDIDQIGSTIAGKGLKVILKGTRA